LQDFSDSVFNIVSFVT